MRTQITLLLVFTLLAGCSRRSSDDSVIVTKTFSTPDAQKQFAEGSNQFAFDLYSRLRETDGNLVVSPVSVATALGMVLGGARGDTEKEIAAVLHVPDLKSDQALAAAADLQNDLNGRGEERPFELAIANRLWAQTDKQIRQPYADMVRQHFGAEMGRVDFTGAPEAAVNEINAWAARATRDKIPAALDRDHINDMTRLVLVNAVYFLGKWQAPFKQRHTHPRDFYRSADDKLEVPTMFKDGYFGFRHVDGQKILRMPYKGEELSMIFLLPDEIDGIDLLESQLTREKLRDWTSDLESTDVLVWLPKFKFTADLELNGALALSGMPSAFDPATADLSGIDGIPPNSPNRDEGLCIQHVIHRAIIEVDEEGTEAAATTAITKTMTADKGNTPPPKEFRADRPFLFLIQHEPTGAILFLGRVTDPTSDTAPLPSSFVIRH
jgi:serine protease inhibitor